MQAKKARIDGILEEPCMHELVGTLHISKSSSDIMRPGLHCNNRPGTTQVEPAYLALRRTICEAFVGSGVGYVVSRMAANAPQM